MLPQRPAFQSPGALWQGHPPRDPVVMHGSKKGYGSTNNF